MSGRCRHCGEPLLPHEWQHEGFHHECITRVTLGSVGHQRQRCPCYGGCEEDPPGMTVREAARAAFDHGYKVYEAEKKARRN